MPWKSHQVTTQYLFSIHMFSIFSCVYKSKSFNCEFTIYKQIFLELVAPSTKILLIMILHYCYFKTGKPDRATTIYRYLIKRLWKEWFPYFYLSFRNSCAKQCIIGYFHLSKLHNKIKQNIKWVEQNNAYGSIFSLIW